MHSRYQEKQPWNDRCDEAGSKCNNKNNKDKAVSLGKLGKNEAITERDDGKEDLWTIEWRNGNEIENRQTDIDKDNKSKNRNK